MNQLQRYSGYSKRVNINVYSTVNYFDNEVILKNPGSVTCLLTGSCLSVTSDVTLKCHHMHMPSVVGCKCIFPL